MNEITFEEGDYTYRIVFKKDDHIYVLRHHKDYLGHCSFARIFSIIDGEIFSSDHWMSIKAIDHINRLIKLKAFL